MFLTDLHTAALTGVRSTAGGMMSILRSVLMLQAAPGRSEEAPIVGGAAKRASSTAQRCGTLRRCTGSRIFMDVPGLTGFMNLIGFMGVTVREGLRRELLAVFRNPTVTGGNGDTGIEGHLRARPTGCGFRILARCQNTLYKLLMIADARERLHPRALYLRRGGTRDHVRRMRKCGTSGEMELRPTMTLPTSAGGCEENRGWRLLFAVAESPPGWTSRRARRGGIGAPASGLIQCMSELAVAHRDPLPLLRLLIVAPCGIAMGTSYKSDGGTPSAAMTVDLHSAAKGV